MRGPFEPAGPSHVNHLIVCQKGKNSAHGEPSGVQVGEPREVCYDPTPMATFRMCSPDRLMNAIHSHLIRMSGRAAEHGLPWKGRAP